MWSLTGQVTSGVWSGVASRACDAMMSELLIAVGSAIQREIEAIEYINISPTVPTVL